MEPRRVHEVVHTLRQKPLHVRQNIALGVAGGVTMLVALGWFLASSVNGTFSLVPQSVASATHSNIAQTATEQTTGFSDLLGAAGAAIGASSSPTTITIVDTKTSSTLDADPANQNDTDQTVIHF